MYGHRRLLPAAALGLLALLAVGVAAVSAAQIEGWILEGNQNGANLGHVVAPAGDVNGDGYVDLLVGGRYDFGNGGTSVAYAYYGGGPQDINTIPDWTAPNDQPNQYAFPALASAGDVNGDGIDDVIVGASHYTDDELEEGRAYVYYGSYSGLSTTPGWVTDGNQWIMYYGAAVAGAGDVNRDGFDDVLVGAPYKRDPVTNDIAGQALLYLGSPTGLSTTPSWSVLGAGDGYFGGRLNAAGDVNGDGYDDVIVSDYFFSNDQQQEGRVFLYLGSPTGLGNQPAWTAEGNQDYAYFGRSLAPAGDVNLDGYDEVIIGAPSFNNPDVDEGRAFLFYGTSSGLSLGAGWTAEGNQYAAQFGSSVASAGDVNFDNYDDVVIGAPGFFNGELNEGAYFLYLGSAGGLVTEATFMGEGNQISAAFGSSVSKVGDASGDGRDEWVVSAPQYDRGETDEGIVLRFDDSITGPLPTPPVATQVPTPTQTPLQLHISDLDSSATLARNTWTALVTAEVSSASISRVPGATVSGAWSTGATGSCTTGVNGRCTIQLSGLSKKVNRVTFTVNNVQHNQGVYQATANTDPDGDSNGTQITVVR